MTTIKDSALSTFQATTPKQFDGASEMFRMSCDEASDSSEGGKVGVDRGRGKNEGNDDCEGRGEAERPGQVPGQVQADCNDGTGHHPYDFDMSFEELSDGDDGVDGDGNNVLLYESMVEAGNEAVDYINNSFGVGDEVVLHNDAAEGESRVLLAERDAEADLSAAIEGLHRSVKGSLRNNEYEYESNKRSEGEWRLMDSEDEVRTELPALVRCCCLYKKIPPLRLIRAVRRLLCASLRSLLQSDDEPKTSLASKVAACMVALEHTSPEAMLEVDDGKVRRGAPVPSVLSLAHSFVCLLVCWCWFVLGSSSCCISLFPLTLRFFSFFHSSYKCSAKEWFGSFSRDG